MCDGFRRLRLRETVVRRPIEVRGKLGDLTGRNKRADCNQAPIARRKVRTQPQVAE